MTTISDNTATNLLLDRIIIRRVWDKMEKLGLSTRRFTRRRFLRSSSVAMDSSVKYGLGVTTPNEMAQLFELLAHGKAVTQPRFAMLDILAHNERHAETPATLRRRRVGAQDRRDERVRTECALFYLRNRVVACVLTKENKDERCMLDNEPQSLNYREQGKGDHRRVWRSPACGAVPLVPSGTCSLHVPSWTFRRPIAARGRIVPPSLLPTAGAGLFAPLSLRARALVRLAARIAAMRSPIGTSNSPRGAA